jgi:hypothetical protein
MRTYRKANTAAFKLLAILKSHTHHVVILIRVHGRDPLLVQHIETQLPDLASHQGASVGIELSGENPLVAIDQGDLAKVFQVRHGLGGFESKQASSDRDSCLALVF